MKSNFFLVIAVIVLCFIKMTPVSASQLVDRIVVTVNNQIITHSDIVNFNKQLSNKGLVDDALLNFYDLDAIRKDDKARLDYLTDERLIDSKVSESGIVATIEKIEGEIRSIVQRSGTSREALKASLRSRGLSYAEYQNFIKKSLQRQSLLQREVSSKIKISDEEIAAYYIQNSNDNKALVFEYELSHILFLSSNGGDRSALGRAQEVHQKLSGGALFEQMASQHSEDPRFTQGGLFGEVKVGEIIPALEKALKGKSPGEITEIVKMPDGYHIFKVLRRTLSPSPAYTKSKPQIAQILFAESFRRQYFSWIESLRQSAFIKYNSYAQKD